MAQPTLQPFEFDAITVNQQGQEINRKRGTAQYCTESLDNGVGLTLVAIPGGSFLMGSPESEAERHNNERLPHPVTVEPFLMGKYPVTQMQWRAVAALPKLKHDLHLTNLDSKGLKRAMDAVDWYPAVEFCARLTAYTGRPYRLPTEAEWEYACRAGTTTPFHCGATLTTDLANYNSVHTSAAARQGLAQGSPTDVDQFPPNAFGLNDMHGNVEEWCVVGDKQAPFEVNASGGWTEKVLRGGSWCHSPRQCRSASRDSQHCRLYRVGLRVVCEAL